jgi:hypothetical protein
MAPLMYSRPIAAAAAFCVLGLACSLNDPLKDRCQTSADCREGRVCVAGTCFADGGQPSGAGPSCDDMGSATAPGVSAPIVCGRWNTGINCALSTGTTFGPPWVWQSVFSDANGWDAPEYYSTIAFADLNNDGLADLCGRGKDGINCALSDGTSFGAVSLWQSSFSDDNGWKAAQYYSTIKFVDINGDGKADVCGRSSAGIDCALSNGTSFEAESVWESDFSDTNGWTAPQYYSTIAFPDLNGDGKADICGRGVAGIDCALSNGTTFYGFSRWQASFGDAFGWNLPQYYSTIKFADVNGDGKADVCGRGSGGIGCALSNGTTFDEGSAWQSSFSDVNGWTVPQYYSTIAFADIDGDGKADVCGRNGVGINCAQSTGSSFGTERVWQSSFSDASGWNAAQYYSTLRLVDVNNDGKADVCGRGADGIACVLSNGTSFDGGSIWQSSAFSDANGWNAPQYYATISFPQE